MQSKHSHSKKKNGFPIWIPVVLVLILVLAAAVIFLLPRLRVSLPEAQPTLTPEPVEVTEELPPEPVDLREYHMDMPSSGIDVVDDSIEMIRAGIQADFDARNDGSVPASLRTSYIQGSDPDIFNFILTVEVNDEVTDRRTYCFSKDGEMLDSTAVLGENFAVYLQDYINLCYYTSNWSFNDNGVIVLKDDISEAVPADPASFSLYLLSSSGADFLLMPEILPQDREPLSPAPLTLPEKISYSHEEANASDSLPQESPEGSEAVVTEVPAPEQPLPEVSSEPVPEESAPAESPAGTENLAENTVSESAAVHAPDPALAALADEMGALRVFADFRVLQGDLYECRRLWPDKPMVALTFDDGPNDTSSLTILDVLESHKAVATFFEVGVNVAKYPEVVQREVEIGCEVGSHTYNHFVLGEQTYDYIVYDRQMCADVFTSAIGFVPKIVRPPEGNVMGYTLGIYSEPLIGWSIDTLDWLYKNTAGNVATVQKAGNLDGQVILMHSIYPESAASVEPIVEYIQSQGYQMVTISELLEYCYRIEPEGFHYYAYDFFIKGRPEYTEPVLETVPDLETESAGDPNVQAVP